MKTVGCWVEWQTCIPSQGEEEEEKNYDKLSEISCERNSIYQIGLGGKAVGDSGRKGENGD